MSRINKVIPAIALGACAVGLHGAETIESQITKVDVFKNGIGVITRSLETPAAAADGIYRYTEVPSGIHGTIFFDGLDGSGVAVRNEVLPVPVKWNAADIPTLFGGHTVTLLLEGERSVTGKVVAPPLPEVGKDAAAAPRTGPAGMVMLESDSGSIVMVPAGGIKGVVDASGFSTETHAVKTVMEISAAAPLKGASMQYLANGIAWAPSYRIDLSSKDRMAIKQSAILRNELEDFTNAEIRVISGYPNIQYSSVGSLFNPGMTLAQFLGQLGGGGNIYAESALSKQRMVGNAMPMYDMAAGGYAAETPELPPDSVDIFFQPLGKLSMKYGESRYLDLASAETTYRKVLDWKIPAQQDLDVYPVNRSQESREEAMRDIWDCIVFVNPFDFPLTTAPAVIYTLDDFNAQSELAWVNPKREGTIRVTKALSLKTEVVEKEDPDKPRETVKFRDNTYQKVNFIATIRLTNYRNEPVEVRISKDFFGTLESADDGADASVLPVPRYWGVNNLLNNLKWTVNLAPEEEKEVTFRYSMLM